MSSQNRRVALLLAGAATVGCGVGFGDIANEPGLPPNPPIIRPEDSARIREDFNNRDLIGKEIGGIIVDTNRGVATLQAQMFPDFSGGGAVNAYDSLTHTNGLIEAAAIIIDIGGTLEASDSVELRAEDRVIVAGSLVAGRGGVTIIARQRIQIDGSVVSEGPVRLLLGDDTGTIKISGRISAASHIHIYGRGSVVIDGEISTTTLLGDPPAIIEVYSYGDVMVAGRTAHLYGVGQEAAGGVLLQSESNLLLEDGAMLGNPRDPLLPEFAPGGDIELRASNITLGDDVVVAATESNLREAGKIHATATGRLLTGSRALIFAGSGPDGGHVTLKARAIELGDATRIVGGSGTTQPGTVTISAVASIDMLPFASIEGGSGECARGGDIFLEVGGPISAAEGAQIIGGTANNSNCGGVYPGGAITVFAQSAVGVLEAIVRGQGAEEGALNYNIVEAYSVSQPSNLSQRESGQIESRTIDRSEESLGTIPRLADVSPNPNDMPAGTRAALFLTGSNNPEGPFDEWVPIGFEANDQELSRLKDQRYVRYRVELEGRRFDVPILEYFEIDLAPDGY